MTKNFNNAVKVPSTFTDRVEGQMQDENNRLLDAQREFVKEHGIEAFKAILDHTATKEEFKIYNSFVNAKTALVHGRAAKF